MEPITGIGKGLTEVRHRLQLCRECAVRGDHNRTASRRSISQKRRSPPQRFRHPTLCGAQCGMTDRCGGFRVLPGPPPGLQRAAPHGGCPGAHEGQARRACTNHLRLAAGLSFVLCAAVVSRCGAKHARRPPPHGLTCTPCPLALASRVCADTLSLLLVVGAGRGLGRHFSSQERCKQITTTGRTQPQ